ncbi:lysM and putative peptidoglycan-binding domain-containing protein 3-like [Lytechinus variegatus]|uniref:lysM and putative peptidoglycan-binding domain-containing protein 3-like n=1 Tax=Lytechinus variegatus TaxID=7654 RepID=UPI001BB1DCB4|nr:lysM and putative peptidoglycan-binding domain-containing protein 3-like [Lytechinus variegatus]XP_041464461.1 lysM and putative peptidoglycan-binding domain-containing protein 3-like [Lytechinus variegatus]
MSSVHGFRSKPKHDRSKYMPVSGQVQNVQNSTVYVFGESAITEDEINADNDVEMSELRTRGGGGGKRKKKTKHTEDEMVYVEKDINEGDTLQTFSLRYACRVSELKRINNLIADQDFHARRTLKVPMRRDGILLEIEDDLKSQAAKSLRQVNHSKPHLLNGHRHSDESDHLGSDSDDSQTEFIRTISIPGSLDGENRAAQQFFDKMDKDLHNILEKTRTNKDTLQEVTSVLKETRFRPLRFPKAKSDCPDDGATLGCTTRNIVIALVVVMVIGPLLGLAIAKGWN